MWNYEKRLEYPINIKRTDAAMAKAIISQFGGPDGETGAAMRYLSQRFSMPYRPVMGVLTDVGIEASNRNLPQPKHSPRRLSSGASLLPAANSYLFKRNYCTIIFLIDEFLDIIRFENFY